MVQTMAVIALPGPPLSVQRLLRNVLRIWPLLLAATLAGWSDSAAGGTPDAGNLPAVEVEEEVYRCEPLNNGSGPMWCSGSTCLVRAGDHLLASGMELIKDAQPLNNARWTLWKRGATGWALAQADPVGRTREPCPLAAFADGRILLSANPTLVPGHRNGPARPELLEFRAVDPQAAPRCRVVEWQGTPAFTEHSYRSLAADGAAGEAILFQQTAATHCDWSFLSSDGRFTAKGHLTYPWGSEYDKPQPIRVCYPAVMLANRAVHLFGVSDIVEPYRKWREYKKKLTGRDWDYDFRRLFYTSCDDITTGKFQDWTEIASRDKTAGWTMPCDVHVDRQGTVHLLWVERAIDVRLRKEFFPDAKQSFALRYACLRRGTPWMRHTLFEGGEGLGGETAQWGRFQPDPQGRLWVLIYVDGRDAAGGKLSENRLLELGDGGRIVRSLRASMQHPLSRFFTSGVRFGAAPCDIVDVLGIAPDSPAVLRYARIRLPVGRNP